MHAAAEQVSHVEAAVADQLGGPARRKVIFILAAVLAVQAADLGTTGAVAPYLTQVFGIGAFEIALLVSVTLFVGAAATLPAGILMDRTSRTRVLAVSVVLWCGAIVATGAATSYPMLLITRLVLGGVTATAGPGIASLTGDFFPGRERARVYGLILGGELVGAGLGYLVSGNLAGPLGWRWSFWWLVVPGAVLAWALWKVLPEPARGGQSRIGFHDEDIRSAEDVSQQGDRASDADAQDQPGPTAGQQAALEAGARPNPDLVLHSNPRDMHIWDAVRYVLSVRTNVILIIASALGYSFFEATRTLGLLFVRQHYGLPQSTATMLLLVLGIGALIGVLASGHVSDWLAHKGKLNARILVPAAAFVLSALAFAPGIYVSSVWIAVPLFTLGACALAATNPPMDAARLDVMHSRLWGRAEGVRSTLRSAVQGAAPLLVGLLASLFGGDVYASFANQGTISPQAGHALEYAFLIALIPVVLAAIILLFARGSYATDAATAAESEKATRGDRQRQR